VTGVEKRERQIPIEIQQQAVDLDEKMFGVAAPLPLVGLWQRQLKWGAAAERRDAQGEFHSAAQARAWADG
jgi:hypothetical protein